MSLVSKVLILLGVVFILLGLIWHFSNGNIFLGRLPGDIIIEKGKSKFYFPITTCLILSVMFSIIGYFFKK